ncbi:MAG: hypothetical protein EAZ92_04040 [Candidatus Kapaibacterium sp.]|nr:MAG: hypothetical protein EAZ92_04040 [Candidatus Kapabacteria bacterium]
MRLVAIFFTIILVVQATFAQEVFAQSPPTESTTSPRMVRWSGSVEFLSQFHAVQFLNLPLGTRETIDNAEPNQAYRFRYGVGTGFAGSVGAEIPLSSWLSAGLNLRVALPLATLFSDTLRTPAGRADGSEAVLVSQRRLDTYLHTIGAEMLFRANPLPAPLQGVNLYAGLRGDIISRKDYFAREEMLAESDGGFENGLRTRREQRAELPEVRNLGIANFNAAAIGGLGVEFEFGTNRVFSIEARALADVGLFNIFQRMDAQDEFWRVNSIRGGIALRYYPERENALTEIELRLKKIQEAERTVATERAKIQEDLRELKQSGIAASIQRVVGIDDAGKEVERPVLRIAEIQTVRTQEWLPVLYFTERSSVIPARYRRLTADGTKRFRTEALAKQEPLRSYYHVLNIIGKRLQEQTGATITMTGIICSTGSERNDANLAKERTRSVREYLRGTWGISLEQMQENIEQVSLPENTPEATLAEYRAVRISSPNPEIMRPLEFRGMVKTANPSALRIDLDIRAGVGIKEWVLECSQFDGAEIKTLNMVRGKSEYPRSLVWNMSDEAGSVPNASSAVSLKLDVTDLSNRNSDVPQVEVNVVQENTATQAAKRIYSSTFSQDTAIPIFPKTIGNRSATVYFHDVEPSAAFCDALAARLGLARSALRLVSQGKLSGTAQEETRNETQAERGFYKRLVRVEVSVEA